MINLLAFTTDPDLLTQLSSFNEKRDDCEVCSVETVEDLFQRIDSTTFDAVLIDALGLEIPLSFLTGDLVEQHPGVKIILLTSSNDGESLELKNAVYHSLLTKPFTAEDLVTALEALFNTRQPEKAELTLEEETAAPMNQTSIEDHEPSLIEIIDAAEFDDAPPLLETITSEIAVEPGMESSLDPDPGKGLSVEEEITTRPSVVLNLRLSYCCVLIPRYPQQYLARDLADRAAAILPQVHLSRGWRVTGISVRPQYLQWFISLPADTSPVDAMREIRQRTSVHFYTHLPELAAGRQDGDFWAPGYLMLSGTQPVSPVIIREFIERTRSRQQHGD